MNNLIKDIVDNNILVSNLLRKVKVLLAKLNQPEFLEWVNKELNGYGEKDKYPDYRKLSGEVKFWNPQLGWCPVLFHDSKMEKQISTRNIKQSVVELEELLSDNSVSYEMPYSASAAKTIMKGAPLQTKVSLFISRTEPKRVLDAVRNSLLDWILKLEKEDINLEEKNTGSEIIKLLDYKLRKTIRTTPTEEREVQDAFENLLVGAGILYSRETDSIEYSTKTYTPDFSIEKEDLAVEIKLSNKKEREKKMIEEINDDILAYRTKYKNVIFVVYDIGFIKDVERFSRHFEDQEGVVVRVIKH